MCNSHAATTAAPLIAFPTGGATARYLWNQRYHFWQLGPGLIHGSVVGTVRAVRWVVAWPRHGHVRIM